MKTTEFNCEIIHVNCWNSEQSWHYHIYVQWQGYKLRCVITRNAYDFQSAARVDVLTDAREWSTLMTHPMDRLMLCYDVSYTDTEKRRPGVTGEVSEKMYHDAKRLFALASRLLLPTGRNEDKLSKQLDHYHRLHDGLSDMIESGRLEANDIPDDYAWLVDMLATDATVGRPPNFRIMVPDDEHGVWRDLGEGPFPTYSAALSFASAEVGADYLIEKVTP